MTDADESALCREQLASGLHRHQREWVCRAQECFPYIHRVVLPSVDPAHLSSQREFEKTYPTHSNRQRRPELGAVFYHSKIALICQKSPQAVRC